MFRIYNRQKSAPRAVTSLLCAAITLISALPPLPVLAQQTSTSSPTSVRKGSTKVTIFEPQVLLSDDPLDDEIFTARLFREAITPAQSKAPLLEENKSLGSALRAYKEKIDSHDVSDLKNFILAFPESRWRPALELNIAHIQFELGRFTEALALYKNVWESQKNETNERQQTLANEALAEYLLLSARLGRKNDVESHLKLAKARKLTGSTEEKVRGAEEGLAAMNGRPDCAFKCGPFALNRIAATLSVDSSKPMPVMNSTEKGTNMAQLRQWAHQSGLDYQIARRSTGAPLLTPSIVHWKSDHFAAVSGQHDDKFHVEDSTFGVSGNFWLSMQDIDSESDGYFLVPAGQLPNGWQAVTDDVGRNIWGKGAGHERSGPDEKKCLNGCSCKAMPKASVFGMLATLNIEDQPLGYSPPIGPTIDFKLNYNYLEKNQPATPVFTTFGPDWSLNWVCYLTVDASNNLIVRRDDGQSEIYNFMDPDNLTNPYPVNPYSQATVSISGKNSFTRTMPDGSMQVFDQPDGTGRVFMTKAIDTQGNSATITYNSNFRVSSVTDAIGQVSNFSYLSNTVSNTKYYKVFQISDAFLRVAEFAWDDPTTPTRIVAITDAVGMQSSFVYDPDTSFISRMQTPYGVTTFQNYVPPESAIGNHLEARGFRALFPDNTMAVLENWAGPPLQSYYWDRHAMDLYPTDPGTGIIDHCETTSYLVSAPDGNFETSVPRKIKMPLEGEVSFTYEGEGYIPEPPPIPEHIHIGNINKPIEVKRTLDVGGDQISTFEYNATGQLTKSIDPIGRTYSYRYSANNIDLLEVREVKGGNNFLLGKWQYNDKHLPLVYIDGSGRKTQYSYTSTGQLQQVTDANGKVTIYGYDSDHYLTSIDGPLPGDKDKSLMHYTDGQIDSTTDSEGYTLNFFYDNLDRLVKTSYPDGTFEEFKFNKLDQIVQIDRLGRVTQSVFDSMDQLVKTVDPLGRATEYTWCSCGSLVSLTDGAGHKTLWHHDLQGRTTSKEYADGSTVDFEYETNTSRLKSRTDALNQKTNYVYNKDNTLAQVTYDNEIHPTSDVTLAWDQNYQRIISVENGWGKLEYLYNAYIADPFGTPITGGGMLQKIKHYINPGLVYDSTRDIAYQYDVLGRTTNRSINNSANSVTWAYDEMSRVTSETNSLGAFSFNYVDQGTAGSNNDRGTTRLSKITYPNSQTTKFSYFGNLGDQRLQQIANLNPSGGQLSQFNYGYDAAGQITQWQQQQNGSNLSYGLGYDRAGQLTAARAGSGLTISPFAQEYQYDYDLGANRTAVRTASVETLRIGGTKTTGDTLTITVNDSGLPSGARSIAYTVQGADTLQTMAASLASNITSNEALQALGINAVSNLNSIEIRSISSNITTYTKSTSGGATETITSVPHGDGSVNATVTGTKTTNDVLKIRVYDPAISGGFLDVSYTVLSGDTLSSIATGLMNAVNANSTLQPLGVSASSIATVINLRSKSPNFTRFDWSVTGASTEAISLSMNVNPLEWFTVGGTKTTNDVLKISIFNTSLPSGNTTITYTVQGGDTLSTIASAVATAINADTNLNNQNIKASATSTVISIRSASPNLTSYSQSVNDFGTETLVTSLNPNPLQIISIGGTKTTGDVLTVTFYNVALTGGAQAISYTVLAGDTLTSIAAAIKSAINANSNLQAAGITAVSVDTKISIDTNTNNLTTIRKASNTTATESIVIVPKHIEIQTAILKGVATTGDALSITFFDANLPGAQITKTYTVPAGNPDTTVMASAVSTLINSDTDLKAAGISASALRSVVNIISTSTDITTYSQTTNTGATARILLALNTGVMKATHTDLNELTTLSPGGATSFEGNSTRPLSFIIDPIFPPGPDYSATKSTTISISVFPPASTTYTTALSAGATETLSVGGNNGGSTTIAVGGKKTTGDILTINVLDSRLPGGQAAFNYTVQASDTLLSIAESLAPGAFSIGMSSTTRVPAQRDDWSLEFTGKPELGAGKNVVNIDGRIKSGTIKTNSYRIATIGTNYSTSVNTGSTVSMRLGDSEYGNAILTIGGTITAGNVATLTVHDPILSSPVSLAYTVQVGDSTTSIATALKNAINADPKLAALGVSATSSGAVISIKSNKTGQAALAYDANGNMTSDGINTYEWDAENRLTKINYPGTNNFTQITHDGVGRRAKIVETASGSITSTRQLVWCRCSPGSRSEIREIRDSGGTVLAQYFGYGQVISGTNYYCTRDHLDSVRELAASSGSIQTQYNYSPYGRATRLQGSLTSDFQFADYYQHAPTGLSFTRTRPYQAALGRWINRDPIAEAGGSNLYSYTENRPISYADPSGLKGSLDELLKLPYVPPNPDKFPKCIPTWKPETGWGGKRPPKKEPKKKKECCDPPEPKLGDEMKDCERFCEENCPDEPEFSDCLQKCRDLGYSGESGYEPDRDLLDLFNQNYQAGNSQAKGAKDIP